MGGSESRIDDLLIERPTVQELFRAAGVGDVETVKRLIQLGVDVNYGFRADSPLHAAASGGQVAVAELLLKAGAWVDKRGSNKATPLHWAASGGHVGVAELLLKTGARLDSKDVSLVTPLHKAATGGHVGVAELLLKAGARMDSKDRHGKTPRDMAESTDFSSRCSLWEKLRILEGREKILQLFATAMSVGPNRRKVGPEGGILQIASCTVIVPPGAVTMETEITYQVIDPNDVTLPLKDGAMLVSDVIELGPHGTTFHQPVTVQMQCSSTSSGGAMEAVMMVTENRSQWKELKTTKISENRLAASVNHTNIFAVISKPKQDQIDVPTDEGILASSTQSDILIDRRKVGPEGGELQTKSCTVKVPPGAVTMETEMTCQVINPNDVTLPLEDGEMLVSDVIELGPHGTTFHKPVTVQMKYSRASSGGAMEAVMMVTENRSQWKELTRTEQGDNKLAVSVDHFSTFAVISQLKQDQFIVPTEKCTLTSSTQPAVQISFPKQAVATPTQVTIQVQEVPKRTVEDMKAKDQSSRGLVSTSPIVTVATDSGSAVRFLKPVTVRVPHPKRYMDIQHELPNKKLKVMSYEKVTEDWIDETDNSNPRESDELVEFEASHCTRWIVIVVTDDFDDPKEFGPIPLKLCRWLQNRDVQFILLQREDNAKQVVIECTPAKDAEEKRAHLMREGYKAPLPTDIVTLFEGQRVEVKLVGNVKTAFDLEINATKQQITFHSQRSNRLHMQVMKGQQGLDGEGIAAFFSLPRVEVTKQKGMAARVRRTLETVKDRPPKGFEQPKFLCQLPIHVPYEPAKRIEGASLEGVEKYFYNVKEEVSTDWGDLAFRLGIKWATIRNITGRNPDDKSRCMDMLQEWKKREGDAATIDVLMEALSDTGLQSVEDGLKSKYPDIGTAGV